MILEAVLFRSHQVAALVLSDLDLPLPGGGGAPGVDIYLQLIALKRYKVFSLENNLGINIAVTWLDAGTYMCWPVL